MASLEDLQPRAYVEGLAPGGPAKVVQREWFGDQVLHETNDGSWVYVRFRTASELP